MTVFFVPQLRQTSSTCRPPLLLTIVGIVNISLVVSSSAMKSPFYGAIKKGERRVETLSLLGVTAWEKLLTEVQFREIARGIGEHGELDILNQVIALLRRK